MKKQNVLKGFPSFLFSCLPVFSLVLLLPVKSSAQLVNPTYLGVNLSMTWQKTTPDQKLEHLNFPWFKDPGFGLCLNQRTGGNFETGIDFSSYWYYLFHEVPGVTFSSSGSSVSRITSLRLSEYYNFHLGKGIVEISPSLGAGFNFTNVGQGGGSTRIFHEGDTIQIHDSYSGGRDFFVQVIPGIRFSATASNGMRFSLLGKYAFGFVPFYSGFSAVQGTNFPYEGTTVSSDGKLLSVTIAIEYPISRIWKKN